MLEAVDGYRAFFQPSDVLDKPYVSVSADVVVAEDEETAHELATGYPAWGRSIRTAEGAIEYPTPEQARAFEWSEEDRELVRDRVDTRHAGDRRRAPARRPTGSGRGTDLSAPAPPGPAGRLTAPAPSAYAESHSSTTVPSGPGGSMCRARLAGYVVTPDVASVNSTMRLPGVCPLNAVRPSARPPMWKRIRPGAS